MSNNDKDLKIRQFEQMTQSDSDLEAMVPPLWSRSTVHILIGVLVVLAIIGAATVFWG